MDKDKAFPLPLEGRFVGDCRWKLLAPFVYENSSVRIEVPVDFVTDGKSIPKIAWSIVGSPWSGDSPYAAVPHDWGYHTQTRSREEVDKDFIEGMRILGVPLWKRRIMYRMVRTFAWICWNKRKGELDGEQ